MRSGCGGGKQSGPCRPPEGSPILSSCSSPVGRDVSIFDVSISVFEGRPDPEAFGTEARSRAPNPVASLISGPAARDPCRSQARLDARTSAGRPRELPVDEPPPAAILFMEVA